MLNSPCILIGPAVLAVSVAYCVFAPKTPTGITAFHDAALHRELSSRYGVPGATVLELSDGRLMALGRGRLAVLFTLD